MKAKECYGCQNIVGLTTGKCNVCGGSNFRVFSATDKLGSLGLPNHHANLIGFDFAHPKPKGKWAKYGFWGKSVEDIRSGLEFPGFNPKSYLSFVHEGDSIRWGNHEQLDPKPRTKSTTIPDGRTGRFSDSELRFVDDKVIEDEITDTTDTDKLLREIEGILG